MAMDPKKLKGTRTNKASKNKLKKRVTPQVEMTSVGIRMYLEYQTRCKIQNISIWCIKG